MPRLAAFIRDHTEQILTEWETFARSLSSGASMNVEALSDHAKEMLDVLALELGTPRSSRKLAADADDQENRRSDTSTAAQVHGAGRAQRGFTIAETVAEFRALRVGVLTLWLAQARDLDAIDLLDMSRFNEGIDQAIAESITRYSGDLERTKDRFIAILGHDLRSPLNAITMSASFLLEEQDLHEPLRGLVTRIAVSARTMKNLVADLLDFARIRFGAGIPIEPRAVDLRAIISEVVAEVSASHPDSDVRVDATGELRGEWDFDRLAQALTNVITNAVEHGSPRSPIQVAASGTPTEVVISVHNLGLVIPAEQLGRLFDAMAPRPEDDSRGDEHLGLGLYIVQSIIIAHGGTINVDSSPEKGTTFTVRLPTQSSHGRRDERHGDRPTHRDGPSPSST